MPMLKRFVDKGFSKGRVYALYENGRFLFGCGQDWLSLKRLNQFLFVA
jgi:hypothetical protein